MKGRISINNNDNNKTGTPSLTEPSSLDDYEVIDAEEGEVEEGHGDVIEEGEEEKEQEQKTSLVLYDPLRRYLLELRKYPLLTKEEEQNLALAFKEKGDLKAGYVLVVSNLRLVIKIAMEYQKSWVTDLMDLIQEGNIGLIQAVKKFDPLKGIRLSYYASFWIKAYILKYILDNWRLVKIGTTQAQRRLFFNLQKEKARLTSQGYKPDSKYLAEILQVREKDILEMSERLALPEKSLDSPSVEDYRYPIKDIIPIEEVPIDQKLSDEEAKTLFQKKLKEFYEILQGRDRYIFENRLMNEQPETLQEIGKKYGITRERARQLEAKLIKKLKDFLQQDGTDLSSYQLNIGGR
jgi:RNA polymerase, sigma 32 subunit, RpoH